MPTAKKINIFHVIIYKNKLVDKSTQFVTIIYIYLQFNYYSQKQNKTMYLDITTSNTSTINATVDGVVVMGGHGTIKIPLTAPSPNSVNWSIIGGTPSDFYEVKIDLPNGNALGTLYFAGILDATGASQGNFILPL